MSKKVVAINVAIKANYIIDNNNYADNGYKNLDDVPIIKMLCGIQIVIKHKRRKKRNKIK